LSIQKNLELYYYLYKAYYESNSNRISNLENAKKFEENGINVTDLYNKSKHISDLEYDISIKQSNISNLNYELNSINNNIYNIQSNINVKNTVISNKNTAIENLII
jgi:predicted  nucleic acid-binding Zn-ribbon protein